MTAWDSWELFNLPEIRAGAGALKQPHRLLHGFTAYKEEIKSSISGDQTFNDGN